MANSFKSWMLAQFEHNQLADMANHGANTGWNGLIYTSEILELYASHKDAIWEMLNEDCESLGEQNVVTMIGHFNGAKNVDSADSFETLLIWYAAEKVAYDETQGEYQSEDHEHDEENIEGELAY